MKLYSNQLENLPKNLTELLEINGYQLESFDPAAFKIKDHVQKHSHLAEELHLFLCFIDYVHITDINQFPFLETYYEIPNHYKFFVVLNDMDENSDPYYDLDHITDIHLLSDSPFALVQKIKLQESNFNQFRIWGAKVLMIDHDISNLKMFHKILTQKNYITLCCANSYEFKKLYNSQVKLIILSEKFSLNQKLNLFLHNIQYRRNKICILNNGSKELISEIKREGYQLIFEKPLKLESLLEVIQHNIRANTTTLLKKELVPCESFAIPLQILSNEKIEQVNELTLANDYYQSNNELNQNKNNIFFVKNETIADHHLKSLKENDSPDLLNENAEISSNIFIKKDKAFYEYAQKKLHWLTKDLFVKVSQLEFFPENYPDIWFPFFQKDLKKSFESPAAQMLFLTFHMNQRKDLINQSLNAAVLTSLLHTRAIADEYGEWPDSFYENWRQKQKDHATLIKLSLCIRTDIFQNLYESGNQSLESVLSLNKEEANVLQNFQWVSPFEETFDLIHLARILKMVHRFLCLNSGVFHLNYSEEPLTKKDSIFHIAFDDSTHQYRKEELQDFLYLMQAWDTWHYLEKISEIKTFPCGLTRPLIHQCQPIKIECINPIKAPDYQHMGFCKGCHNPYYNPTFDRKINYCRSANEKLLDLGKKLFGNKADLGDLYDDEINVSKRNSLL